MDAKYYCSLPTMHHSAFKEGETATLSFLSTVTAKEIRHANTFWVGGNLVVAYSVLLKLV